MTERRKIQDINKPGRKTEPLKRRVKSASVSAPTKKPTARTRRTTKAKSGSSVPTPRIRARKRSSAATRPKARSYSPIVDSHKDGGHGAGVLWGVASVLLIVLAYVVSASLAKASLLITLKEQVSPISATLDLYKDGVQDNLDFDTVTFPISVSKEVEEASSEQVADKAFGTIIIYNNHSTKDQRLVEETRFEDPNGLVYKLGKGAGLIVPGRTGSGDDAVPGSIEAVIYASDPGPEYNQPATDFVIPGFRGNSKFEGFYARSTDDLTGGYIGERPVLTTEQQILIEGELGQALSEKLDDEIAHRIPEGYLALPEELPLVLGEVSYKKTPSGFLVERQAEVTRLIVQQSELTAGLLDFVDLGEETAPIDRLSIINLDELEYDLSSTSTEEQIGLTIEGDVRLRWDMDELVIKNLVSGVRKKDFGDVLEKRFEIQSAKAEVKPGWVGRLPKKFDRISVLFSNVDS